MFNTEAEREKYIKESEERLAAMLADIEKEIEQLDCCGIPDPDEEEIIVGENC